MLTVQALSLNVEHCGANVGKQYTVALKFYIAKALPLRIRSQHTSCGM